jgi:hypothetical protein
MTEPLFVLDLPLCRKWRVAEQLRVGIVSCLSSLYPSADYCETVGMVVSELLENALKYGHGVPEAIGPSSLRIRVTGNAVGVDVEVSNPVDPRDANLYKLFEILEHINHASSPHAAYVDRMREVATGGGAGGLGLARVAYEANCSIEARVGADKLLRVRAVTRPDRIENLWSKNVDV